MPDSSTATPLPAPDAGANNTPNLSVVPPAPKRRARSALNQSQQRDIQRAKTVAKAAQDPAHTAKLEARGINAAFLTALLADTKKAEECATKAISCTDKKEGATLEKQTAEKTLITNLRIAQAAARQKYFHSQPAKLKDYLVGERIDANRATLDQAAQTVVSKLNEDRPPGIDTAFIEKVDADRAAWAATHSTQNTESGKGKTERELRDAQVQSIKERTQQIQFGADAAWPAGVPGHGGVRRQFLLPLDRPFAA